MTQKCTTTTGYLVWSPSVLHGRRNDPATVQTKNAHQNRMTNKRVTVIMEDRPSRNLRLGRRPVPLEITQREMNGIYLLSLKGRLVLGDESNGLRTVIEKLLSSGATRIVINLEHVNYVDSSGVGSLIEAHRKTKNKGGQLKLSNLRPNLKQALELARLLNIFETSPDEAAAVAGF
jgi:anti-anti-sigma factor